MNTKNDLSNVNVTKLSNNKNKTYFISDLHLDPSRPDLFSLFHKFIEKIRPDAEALYILGDLFEFWIGDDVIDLPWVNRIYLLLNSCDRFLIQALNYFSFKATEIF